MDAAMMRAALFDPRQGKDSTTGLEGAYANPDRTLVVTPTPNCVYPQSGYTVGGYCVEELRRKVDRTSMPGVSQGDRIRLRPVGTTWLSEQPDRPGNLDDTTFRAFDKACTRAPGKKPAPYLLSRILRASRRSGAWVDMRLLP